MMGRIPAPGAAVRAIGLLQAVGERRAPGRHDPANPTTTSMGGRGRERTRCPRAGVIMPQRRRRRSGPVAEAARERAGRARVEVAQVAARLMAEEGVPGFAEAKSRAADRLGVHGRQVMPRNDEIEAEIRAYQALFQSDEQPAWLARMRQVALEVMDLLEPFGPRLVGSVLRGTAAREAEVTLHVFADPPEAVATFLYDRHVRWELDAWVGRFGGNRESELPMYRIRVDDQPVRLVVFPREGSREAPRSPVDGKPMTRMNRAQVAELLAAEPPDEERDTRACKTSRDDRGKC